MIPFQSFRNTLKWKFENYSTLSREERFSDVFSIGPTEWKISVCNTGSLEIRLYYDSANKNDKNWLCETEATFKLLRQSGTEKHFEMTRSDAFHSSQLSWRYPKFTTWFHIQHNDFVENDSIIVEINLNFIYHDFSKKIDSFTDIIVHVEDTEFHLNKWVLCSKSKYFYDLFVTQKSTENIIKLENITSRGFCYLLIPFDPFFKTIQGNIYEDLIRIAKNFGVQSLHRSCEQYLLGKDNKLTIIQNIKIADENDYEHLMKTSIESLKSIEDLRNVQVNSIFSQLKETTKLRVMMRCLDFL